MKSKVTSICHAVVTGAAIVALLVGRSPVYADMNDETRSSALKAITDTADKICGSIPISGERNNVEVKGVITGQLNGLAKKLFDLGVSGSGDVNSTTYEGLVQRDISVTLKDISACKKHIFDTLEEQFFATPSKTSNVTAESEVTGTLQPGDEPTPPTNCNPNVPFDGDGMFPTDTLTILFGDNTILFAGNGTITALQIDRCRAISMTRENTNIYVNADLYNQNGKLVARVSKNKIDAIKGEHVNPTRNGDLTTLVITSDSGDKLLDIKYLNSKTIRVEGVFGCPGHAPVVVRYNQPISGNLFINSCARYNYSPATAFEIQ